MKLTISGVLIAVLFSMMCCSHNNLKEADLNTKSVPQIVAEVTENANSDEEKLRRLFYFVRDEIKFDFIYPQDVPVEKVLRFRRGVCMQKANLLVTMAREVGFKARFKFMYVSKKALEDFLPEFAYNRWMDPFPHTVAEVFFNGKWISMEPTFDKELHQICLKKGLNFGKYPHLRNLSIEFSPDGVIGAQQFFQDSDAEVFYGNDLSPLMEYHQKYVPWYKKLLQPIIFRKARQIMHNLRK